MRIMRYPIFFVSVLFLLSACNKKQTKETPYMDRAEELFQNGVSIEYLNMDFLLSIIPILINRI